MSQPEYAVERSFPLESAPPPRRQSGLWKGHWHGDGEVVAVTTKDLVWTHRHLDVKVTRFPAILARRPLALNANALTILHPGRMRICIDLVDLARPDPWQT